MGNNFECQARLCITETTYEDNKKVKSKYLNSQMSIDNMQDNKQSNINNQNAEQSNLQQFTQLKILGKGSFGKVTLVQHNQSGNYFAMKSIHKSIIKTDLQKRHMETERMILEKIKHPNILSLHYAFQDENKLHLVVDLMLGGNLFYHLVQRKRFTEEIARFYAAQILLGIEHLHLQGIIYRDLKPENCLLDKHGNLRIADFGLSFWSGLDGQDAKSMCGTPEYVAPEILMSRSGHDKNVDWWSFGALIYEMLTGLPPHYDKDHKTMFMNIIKKPVSYPPYLSKKAISLLQGLLQINPLCRLGYGPQDALIIKRHEFFEDLDWLKLQDQQIKPPITLDLQNNQDLRYFQKKHTNQKIANTPNLNPLDENFKFTNFTYDKEHVLVIDKQNSINSNQIYSNNDKLLEVCERDYMDSLNIKQKSNEQILKFD